VRISKVILAQPTGHSEERKRDEVVKSLEIANSLPLKSRKAQKRFHALSLPFAVDVNNAEEQIIECDEGFSRLKYIIFGLKASHMGSKVSFSFWSCSELGMKSLPSKLFMRIFPDFLRASFES
jgi:hypothetical protein